MDGSAPPAVPGLGVGRFLGAGSSGEVWTAVDAASGRTVAVKVLAGRGRAEVSRRESALLRRLDHPHLLRLLRTARTDDGRVALVTEHAAGGSLAALVRARGALDPGEVVTVLTPLAGALAHLHERGVVHGDVAAGNVLFLADGRPVLADLGTAGLLGVDRATHGTTGFADPVLAAGGALRPAGDVHALGALAWFALTAAAPQGSADRPPLGAVVPGVPPALVTLVERCLDPVTGRRPTAAEVAAEAFACAVAAPVRLVPTDPYAAAAEVVTHRLREAACVEPPAPAPRRPGRRRRAVLVAAVAAAVGAGAVAAAVHGPWPGAAGVAGPSAATTGGAAGTSRAPSSSTASGLAARGPGVSSSGAESAPLTSAPLPVDSDAAPPAQALDPLAVEDPVAAVPALSALRAEAFTADDPVALRTADVAGSAALQADLATLDELRRQGVRLDGLRFEVDGAELVAREGETASVRVRVVTGAHRVVSRDGGELVEEVAASAPASVRLVLRRVEGRWQVEQVL